ncbi:aminopeptidase [Tissierella carlieri]|jgi:aminopeptidase|uniref:aminopeptidase n=1 Tax=Tissierella carlieri TaxID=689904 RepID=UPI0028037918|nr:aminopeptidase [uncultured Tissierella sp.]MDU5080939.1 aminopeptidase [Bacillota bacterium]
MEFIDLIPNICEGFPFEKGDFVLLNFWGDNEDLKILDLLSENISKKGIIPFKHHCSNSFFERVVLNLIRNDQKFAQEYLDYLSSFKYVIDIFMYTPSLPNGISEPEIPRFKEYLGELFNSLTQDKKYYIQLTVPTETNASNAGLDYDIYNSALCNALSVDFPKLKKSCKEKVESLKDKNSVEILTGKEYSLKLDISSRKWFVDDGCGDLPPGEVYIAPVENNSNGDLLVSIVNLKGQIYKDVLMTFEDGKLIKSSSKEVDEFFNSLPENFKILCEFGIGLNPQVEDFIGFTSIDEKALGTYHIALGMNHLFGGENNCPFHMDFVFTCDEVIFS